MAGYLGAIPVPQATQHRESFTATSGQTTFNTAGYTVGFLDVYLNGSHLSPADFTATNGSDVVLASGASTGDVCDIISYTAFEVNAQAFTGGLDVTGGITADGLVVSAASANVDVSDTGTSHASQDFLTNSNAARTTIGVERSSGGGLFVGSSGYAAVFGSAGAHSTQIASNNTVRMTVDSSGAVGIKTTTPATNGQFSVRGAIATTNFGSVSGDFSDATTGSLKISHASGVVKLITDQTLSFRTGTTVEGLKIDATGAVTMPAQPAFQVKPASKQNNIAVGSIVSVVFGTEIFDQNADFASNTFTAPVTGKYLLSYALYLENVDTAATYYELSIVTSNRTIRNAYDPEFSSDANYWTFNYCQLHDLDAGDTAKVTIKQLNGTAQTDVGTNSTFSGYLVA